MNGTQIEHKFTRRGLERFLKSIEEKDLDEKLNRREKDSLVYLFNKGEVEDILTETEQGIIAEIEEKLKDLPEITDEERKESQIRLRRLRVYYKNNKSSETAMSVLYEKIIPHKKLSDAERIEIIKEAQDNYEKRIQENQQILIESPEVFIGSAILELRRLKEQMVETDIAETESIRHKEVEIKGHLSAGFPVFLSGETGTGKTYISKKIAREQMKKQEIAGDPEVISGHRFLTREDLTGYLGLAVTKKRSPEDVPDLVRESIEKYRELYPDAGEEDEKIIRDVIEGQSFDSATITRYFTGAVHRAAENGALLIIDEFNYIPPSLFSLLNDIMASTKQLAEGKTNVKLHLSDGTEIDVKKGFGIILTGNITTTDIKRYIERSEIDPALLDRIKEIPYGTPEQETHLSYENSIVPVDKFQSEERIKRELFQIALAELVDEKGNLYAPETALEKVWGLVSAFKVFQKNFAGEPLTDEEKIQIDGQPIDLRLQKIHASMRKLRNIIAMYKKDGYTNEIDWYVFQELISPALRFAPKEAALFYSILRSRGFFRNESFEQNPDYRVIEKFHLDIKGPVKSPENQQMKFFMPDEVASAFYGSEIAWKITEKEKDDIEKDKIAAEKLVQREEIKKMIGKIEGTIDTLCQDEASIDELEQILTK